MKRQQIPREIVEKIAAEHGLEIAPPDHPIYAEGPTVVLVSGRLWRSVVGARGPCDETPSQGGDGMPLT